MKPDLQSSGTGKGGEPGGPTLGERGSNEEVCQVFSFANPVCGSGLYGCHDATHDGGNGYGLDKVATEES